MHTPAVRRLRNRISHPQPHSSMTQCRVLVLLLLQIAADCAKPGAHSQHTHTSQALKLLQLRVHCRQFSLECCNGSILAAYHALQLGKIRSVS